MKRHFFIIFIIIFSLFFIVSHFKKSNLEKVREKHISFIRNHPYNKTQNFSRDERKYRGLPPNAYFEQKYLSEINPYTGFTNKEFVYELQSKLNSNSLLKKVPGESDNSWVERGPYNVGGRTRAIIFDTNDPTNETVFAGGVSGGLWKNTNISNSSSRWVRVGIPENLSVSCIAVDPNNKKVFYVGTGESYVSGEVNGNGLWKSTDGGNTWAKIFGGASGASFLDTNSKLTIISPSSISGDYSSILSTEFGGNLDNPITGNLVIVKDKTEPIDDGCDEIINKDEIKGNIVIIRRGKCKFIEKALKAQTAGAIAVIVVNNVLGKPVKMSGDDSSITIPIIMITKSSGEKIINSLKNNSVSATLSKTNKNSINNFLVPGVQHINDVIIRNNSGKSEVFVAVGEVVKNGEASLGGDSFGLYKSSDGKNFVKLFLPKTIGGNDYEPNNLEIAKDNSIYMSTNRSDVYRDGGGSIFKSTDGDNFNLVYTVNNGLRTDIALSPTNPNTVYVLAHIDDTTYPVNIIKTTDNFKTINDLSLPDDRDKGISRLDFTRGQSYYNLLIKSDPKDENVIYVGGIDLFKSYDGGKSWNQLSHWYGGYGFQNVHADQHGIAFATPSRMLFSNDGGVYFSDNAGLNINSRNDNYNTVQFYSVAVAPTSIFNGKDYFIGGAQDNGTQLFERAKRGINNSVLAKGGDGGESFFDTDGTDKYYISNYVYNNRIVLYDYTTKKDIIINKESGKNGDFINPEDLDSNLNILYSNYSNSVEYRIMRYSNLLGSIKKDFIYNDLMDSSPSKFKVSPYTTNSTKLFVGLSNGKLLKVEKANIDTGEKWTDISGDEFIGSVSDIEFGSTENEIFVTMHNYGVKSIWYTNDGGLNWKNKEGDLPDFPVKAILQNPLDSNEVIIGTELGVWKTKNFNDSSPNWTISYNGMSNVCVLDLDLRDDNSVFAATYGRGIFSGRFLKVTKEDLDGDGVVNTDDNCPNIYNSKQKDSNNNGIGDFCDTSYENPDNISIVSVSETCKNQQDGKIVVNIKQTFVSYTVYIKGPKNITELQLSKSKTFSNLPPGSYNVCVNVNNRDYNQCFEVNVDEASDFSLNISKEFQSRSYTIDISSGTAPYDVLINGNVIARFNNSNFNIKAQESGILEVKTSRACEGVFKTFISGVFLKENPIKDLIEFYVPRGNRSNIKVKVLDVSGKILINKYFSKRGNLLSIPFYEQDPGVYFVKLDIDNSKSIKIIKK